MAITKNGKTKIFQNEWTKFNKHIDKTRIINRSYYLEIIHKDQRINKTEEIRQKARKHLNQVLSKGEVKSYSFNNQDGKITKLHSNWWISTQSMNIDYDSGLIHPLENGYEFKGELILLNKNQFHEKFTNNGSKNIYSTNSDQDLFQTALIQACKVYDCITKRDLYKEHFETLTNKKISDTSLRLLMNDLPIYMKASKGKAPKNSKPYITLKQIKEIYNG
jgi:hypothetical protein